MLTRQSLQLTSFTGVIYLLIPTMQGHINKQMPAGIAMEITRFELEDTTTN